MGVMQDRLIQIKEKISKLIQKNHALENQNDSLLQEINELKTRLSDSQEQCALNENIIQIQKNTINDLTEQNKLIKIAKEMSNVPSSSNHDLKIKINELVRDIDRCIDLLNE
jgi:predicted nuclease with TOPRIM domain